MSKLFLTQEDVDEVAELLSRVSWDEEPEDDTVGIDDTDDDDEDEE